LSGDRKLLKPFLIQQTQVSRSNNRRNFVEGIEGFHWKTDFVRLYDISGLDADDYADQKYHPFLAFNMEYRVDEHPERWS